MLRTRKVDIKYTLNVTCSCLTRIRYFECSIPYYCLSFTVGISETSLSTRGILCCVESKRLGHTWPPVQHLVAFFRAAQAFFIVHEVAHLIVRSGRGVSDGRILSRHQGVRGRV